MKVPAEVQEKIAELGKAVLDDEASEADIGEQGALWLEHHSHVFALDVLAEWWRGRTRSWVYQQTRNVLRAPADGVQLPLPFEELPAQLEVGVARFAHQSVMRLKDWENCLAIYRNRRDQAEVLYRRIERALHTLRPLLEVDEELTTADVMDKVA